MPRKIFLDLDRETFNRIILNKNDEKGIYDKQRLFRGLSKGDSAILSCDNKKLEAYIEDVAIYNSIEDYMKGENVEMFKIDCNNPFDMLQIIEEMQNSKKKLRIYHIGYYPYGSNPPSPPNRKLKFKELAQKYYDKGTDTDSFEEDEDNFDDY